MEGKIVYESNKKDKYLCTSLTNNMQNLHDKSCNTIEGNNGKYKNRNPYHIPR